MRKKTLLVAALLAMTAPAMSACGADNSTTPTMQVPADTQRSAGTVLDRPFTKPELVLTDTHGKRFDLRARTKGRPTLLYFGYTNCPDVCPLTMSNIAVAKKQLPTADQDKLSVVFITTDPERDTPPALGDWLKAQDPDFTGLTGDFEDIQAAAKALGISIDPPEKDSNGEIVSTHGTQVIAFSPKTDAGYVLYGKDTTVDDYTKDLPKIINGEAP